MRLVAEVSNVVVRKIDHFASQLCSECVKRHKAENSYIFLRFDKQYNIKH